jgi:hypothetical protein
MKTPEERSEIRYILESLDSDVLMRLLINRIHSIEVMAEFC